MDFYPFNRYILNNHYKTFTHTTFLTHKGFGTEWNDQETVQSVFTYDYLLLVYAHPELSCFSRDSCVISLHNIAMISPNFCFILCAPLLYVHTVLKFSYLSLSFYWVVKLSCHTLGITHILILQNDLFKVISQNILLNWTYSGSWGAYFLQGLESTVTLLIKFWIFLLDSSYLNLRLSYLDFQDKAFMENLQM